MQTNLSATTTLENEIKEPAYNFSLLDLENNQFRLSDFKDKPILLFFWTSWCPFCPKELKALNDIYPELIEEGLEVLAINVGERAYKVKHFIKNRNLDYKILLDEDVVTSENYGIFGIPTYILIDREGYIRFKGNSFPEDKYKDLIAE